VLLLKHFKTPSASTCCFALLVQQLPPILHPSLLLLRASIVITRWAQMSKNAPTTGMQQLPILLLPLLLQLRASSIIATTTQLKRTTSTGIKRSSCLCGQDLTRAMWPYKYV
jgi:hypothetical protein